MATDKEKLEWLLQGGKLKQTVFISISEARESYIWMDKEDLVYYECPKTELPSTSFFKLYSSLQLNACEIYKEPEWWENIPEQGILCRVWYNKHDKGKSTIYVIIKNRGKNGYFYTIDDLAYENAIPASLNEITPLCLQ